MRASRIWEAHDFRAFVERLSGRVVNSLSKYLHVSGAVDEYNLGVASGYQQTEVWKFGHTVGYSIAYEVAQYMAVQVIDIDNPAAETYSHAFGE